MKILMILLLIIIIIIGGSIWYFSIMFPSDNDPHTYFNHARRAEELNRSFLEEYFIKKGLKKNTIENLRQAHPDWSSGFSQ